MRGIIGRDLPVRNVDAPPRDVHELDAIICPRVNFSNDNRGNIRRSAIGSKGHRPMKLVSILSMSSRALTVAPNGTSTT